MLPSRCQRTLLTDQPTNGRRFDGDKSYNDGNGFRTSLVGQPLLLHAFHSLNAIARNGQLRAQLETSGCSETAFVGIEPSWLVEQRRAATSCAVDHRQWAIDLIRDEQNPGTYEGDALLSTSSTHMMLGCVTRGTTVRRRGLGLRGSGDGATITKDLR